MCICMTESLCCSPETITLLIGFTPIQNKKYFFFFLKNPPEQCIRYSVISCQDNRSESLFSLPFHSNILKMILKIQPHKA